MIFVLASSHQEGSDVTLEYQVLSCSNRQELSTGREHYRNRLGDGLTITRPKLELGPYMGYRLLDQSGDQFTPRRKTCNGPKPGTGL